MCHKATAALESVVLAIEACSAGGNTVTRNGDVLEDHQIGGMSVGGISRILPIDTAPQTEAGGSRQLRPPPR